MTGVFRDLKACSLVNMYQRYWWTWYVDELHRTFT